MDMSTLLPLLLNTKGGGSESDTRSALINMLSNNGAGGSVGGFGAGGGTADILSKAMGANTDGAQKNGGMDTADLMSMLMKSRGGSAGGGMDIATVMSLANSMKQQKSPRLSGIQPIKEIAPSEILGKLVKYFT